MTRPQQAAKGYVGSAVSRAKRIPWACPYSESGPHFPRRSLVLLFGKMEGWRSIRGREIPDTSVGHLSHRNTHRFDRIQAPVSPGRTS